MNDNDYKKIADLVEKRVNKAFKPVQEDLTILKKDLNVVKQDLNVVKQDLEEVKDIQENRVLPSVTYIEKNIKAYKDSYQINNANAKKLEKRVEVLEANADIFPPPEHVLAEVS